MNTKEQESITISGYQLANEVMKTLIYFDIFNYPLKTEEIFRFLQSNSVTDRDVENCLTEMAANKMIHNSRGFYGLQSSPDFFDRRVRGNLLASRLMPIANKRAALIAQFPFVRAVMASGSLSKNYMDENSDLDFFIVTAPGKLWIARTLLVLFKRLAFFNSHKYFCVNYFVDETHLLIEEQNLFTATELATLLPLRDGEIYQRMLQQNPWVTKFFPNYIPRNTSSVLPIKNGLLKRFLETILGPFHLSLDSLFKKVTTRRFERIYRSNYSAHDFDLAFKSTKSVSKNHPRQFQKKIMGLYSKKLMEYNMGTQL